MNTYSVRWSWKWYNIVAIFGMSSIMSSTSFTEITFFSLFWHTDNQRRQWCDELILEWQEQSTWSKQTWHYFKFFTFCLLSIIVENAGEVSSDAEDEHGVDGNGHPYVVGNVVLAIIPVPWASLVDVIAETANIFCQVLSGDINDHVDKEKDKSGQIGQE